MLEIKAVVSRIVLAVHLPVESVWERQPEKFHKRVGSDTEIRPQFQTPHHKPHSGPTLGMCRPTLTGRHEAESLLHEHWWEFHNHSKQL